MIAAADLRKHATNKFPEVVQALLRGENPFPLPLRYARIRTTARREEILRDIATLEAEAAAGLSIDWREIETVRYGRNRIPGDIWLASEADYLRYVGKAEEMRAIRTAAGVLREAFPEIADTLPPHWRLLREGDAEHWERVCRVLAYFRTHPFPDCYARELPIAVPTKFIGQNRSVLERLLPLVAPQSLREAGESLEERLGLRTPDSLVECRLLDAALAPEWKFRQLTIAVGDLRHLAESPARTFLVTENRINFLALPPLPGTIALLGQGYAASRLGQAPFLAERRLLYWGDLDAQGFEILAVLRRHFSRAESVLMDRATWDEHADFRQRGIRSRAQLERFLPQLRPEEAELYAEIRATGQRLEQEHISQTFATAALRQRI